MLISFQPQTFRSKNKRTMEHIDNPESVFVPVMRDFGTPPDIFGRIYAGSSLKRKNDIRRKRAMKH